MLTSLQGAEPPKHRPVTIAFIRFEGTDALIEGSGPEATGEALHQLVSAVEEAAAEQGVSFLASDVDADGGKIILSSGAPTVIGDDEERMLLALRKIVESDLPLPSASAFTAAPFSPATSGPITGGRIR